MRKTEEVVTAARRAKENGADRFCMGAAWRSGADRSVERVVVGRRTAEQELDLLALLESEAPDTVRFTEAIKNAVPYEDRTSVVEAAWQVVLADGVRDARRGLEARRHKPITCVSALA